VKPTAEPGFDTLDRKPGEECPADDCTGHAVLAGGGRIECDTCQMALWTFRHERDK
jgi:hypothetical protein